MQRIVQFSGQVGFWQFEPARSQTSVRDMSNQRNFDCAPRKVLIIPIVIILVVILEEISFGYQKSDSLSYNISKSPFGNLRPVRKQERHGNSLVYWTPHKTGSTSMRAWLRSVVRLVGGQGAGNGIYYPYSNYSDHETRLKSSNLEPKCAFIMGHIRVPPFPIRHDELQLGAVVTTTRHPLNTLASKFFHRTAEKLTEDTFSAWNDITSSKSRRWFFYWHDANPCEPLEYYDGLDHCDLNENNLMLRAKRIADRIDCVVDTDDPDEDLRALCGQMNVRDKKCPAYPERNTRKGRSLYDDFYDIPHLRSAVSKILNVTTILRNSLMEKRCRFLKIGNLTPSGYEDPNWPSSNCR